MAEKWIQKAIKPENKGKLREKLHVKPGKKIPEKKLEKAKYSASPVLRKEATMAKTLRGLRK